MVLHPGGNAQALLTWRANTDRPAPVESQPGGSNPAREHAYLPAMWPGARSTMARSRLAAARGVSGPVATGTGTVAAPSTACARPGPPTAPRSWRGSAVRRQRQQWTGYSDGTLRINGRCLDVTGPGIGATVEVAACAGAASQQRPIRQASANGVGPIGNPVSGTVLTDPDGSTINGTQLVDGP